MSEVHAESPTHVPDPGDRTRTLQRLFREAAKAPREFIQRAGPPSGRGRLRLRRIPAVLLSFLLVVALPGIIVGSYYAFVASDQYVATAKFTVSGGASGDALNALGSVLGTPVSQSEVEGVVEFIQSAEIVTLIEADIPLREIFADSDIDFRSRFESGGSLESFVGYWNRHVDATVLSSGVIELTVRAFSADFVLALINRIMDEAEGRANGTTLAERQRQVEEAADQRDEAEEELLAAQGALSAFQEEHQLIDPQQAAALINQYIQQLERDRASLRAELDSQIRIAPNSGNIARLEEEIVQLDGLIDAEEAELRGEATGGVPLTVLVQEWVNLQAASVRAAEYLSAATLDYQSARLQAESQQIFFSVAVNPILPESSSYPRRAWFTLQVVAVLFGLWGVGLLIYFAVRDHRS